MAEYKQVKIKDGQAFNELLAHTVQKYEGGWNPKDPSYRGFLQKSYDAYRKDQKLEPQDVRKSTFGELRDFSHREFWERPQLENLSNETLRKFMFDYNFQNGPDATMALQKLVGVKEDGRIGNKTNKAIEKYEKEHGENSILEELMAARSIEYQQRMDAWRANNL